MASEINSSLSSFIRTIPDYPKLGTNFYDITTLLCNGEAFGSAVDGIVDYVKELDFDLIVAIEARGFIFGGAVAHKLSKGFVPIRKRGKLPGVTVSMAYDLEYGTDQMEIHADAFNRGTRIVLVDDLIATGGTSIAAIKLLQGLEAIVVAACFVIDLPKFGGRQKIENLGVPTSTLVSFV